MSTNEIETKNSAVLGQKYAYATAALLLGIFCFFSLFGLEKAILAIIFGWLALRSQPEPALKVHRSWAKAGVILGTFMLIFIPTLIFVKFDELRELIEILSKLNGGR